jgi:hypothetical protein
MKKLSVFYDWTNCNNEVQSCWQNEDIKDFHVIALSIMNKKKPWCIKPQSKKYRLDLVFSWEQSNCNCIGGVIISVLVSSVVDHLFKPR